MKKLNKENFKRIHEVACETWKPRLIDWYGSRFAVQDEIEIKGSEYTQMRNACTQEQNKLFDEIFGKETDIMDKIKSVEDAIKYLGEKDEEVKALNTLYGVSLPEHIVAEQEVKVFIKAINDGWVADYEDVNQDKYYPYFRKENGLLVYYYWHYDDSCSTVSARLSLKSSELAEYCGEQMIDRYNKFM